MKKLAMFISRNILGQITPTPRVRKDCSGIGPSPSADADETSIYFRPVLLNVLG